MLNIDTFKKFCLKAGTKKADDIQNNLVNEFVCKYDCIKKLSISDKTLEKAIDKNIQYNGYFYKSLGSKLKFLED